MSKDKLYYEILQAFNDVRKEAGEDKFHKLLDQHSLLKAIKDVKVDEVKKSFKSAEINKYYLALALDLTLQMGVNLKEKSLDSKPAVEIAGLLLEAKANPNDYLPLGYNQKTSFLKDAISAHQDNNMIKTLLNKSTYQINLTASPYLQLALLERKPECPVQAWHLFIAGATLGENLILKLIKQVVCQNNASIFIFLQAIYKYHVNQRRCPIVSERLQQFFPAVLITIIQEFSDDLAKTDQIAVEMSLESSEWKPLEEVDLFYATIKNKQNMEGIFQSYPQGIPQKCRRSPNEEIKFDGLSLQPLMQLSALGEEDGVKVLLEAKADPTVSINGSFAFTWAIKGNRNVETQPKYTNTAMSIFSQLVKVSPEKQNKTLDVISKGCVIA